MVELPPSLLVDKSGLLFSLNPFMDKCGFLIPYEIEHVTAVLKSPSGVLENAKIRKVSEEVGERLEATLIPSAPGTYEVFIFREEEERGRR
jgi:hypothetical protein